MMKTKILLSSQRQLCSQRQLRRQSRQFRQRKRKCCLKVMTIDCWFDLIKYRSNYKISECHLGFIEHIPVMSRVDKYYDLLILVSATLLFL
jgi:hypothetical protein